MRYVSNYFSRVVALVALCLVNACVTVPEPKPAPIGPVPVSHPDLGHEHIPLPDFPHGPYNSNPPSSGAHTPYTAPWGVHERPIANEILIHNLEHGGVVIGYRCEHCPELVDELIALAGNNKLIVIAPNPNLNSVVGLSAWAHTLTFDVLDDNAKRAVIDFFATHHGVDHHPPGGHPHSAPPKGAAGHP
jgi:hypothetical protein